MSYPDRPNRFARIVLRVLFYGFVIFAAFVFFWPVGGGKEPATKTMCLSRLKSMAVAANLYAEDNDERFPVKPWMKAITQFDKDLKFTCAKLEVEEGLKWGYALERAAAGKALGSIKDPSHTPLFIETDALAPDMVVGFSSRSRARHGRGSNIAMTDVGVRFRNFDWKPEPPSPP